MSDAADAERRAALVWNERLKLRATWLNNVGVAVVVIGTVTPLVTYSYGVPSAPRFEAWSAFLLPLAGLVAGVGINAVASAILGMLR